MSNALEDYEFKKILRFLKSIRGQGTELISIYVPPDYNMAELANKLRAEYSQASNIKSKQTRKNVLGAIERILQAIKGIAKPPDKGVAIFCGNIATQPGASNIQLYIVHPPKPIPVQVYRCDSTFFLDPLLEMLEPDEIYGILLVDRKEATLAYLKGKRIEIIQHRDSFVPSKHRAGGQSSVRFERLIEIAANEWFKKVGDMANQYFSDPKVKGVIVGGPGPTKHYFLNGDYLNHIVKKKIVGIVDTSYTDEFGVREVLEKSGEIMKELAVVKEKRLLNQFLKEASRDGLATYGEKEVRDALLQGKVDTLLISEKLTWERIRFKCPQCGYEEEITVKGEIPRKTCPKCGSVMNIVERRDLIEELAKLAEETGAKVELISTDTVEGKQFLEAFGGIGALLRFK